MTRGVRPLQRESERRVFQERGSLLLATARTSRRRRLLVSLRELLEICVDGAVHSGVNLGVREDSPIDMPRVRLGWVRSQGR